MTEKNSADENIESSEAAAASKTRNSRKAKPKKAAISKRKKTPAKKRGRPVWQPSIADRTTVEQMKFVGESDAMIARALKVDVDTLRKHCAYELENGYANRRKQVIGKLFDAAEAGNVSAIKRLDEMGKISGAAAAMKDREGGPAPVTASAAKAPKLGKKEERQVAAERVASSGKFSPPDPPKLVVVNR